MLEQPCPQLYPPSSRCGGATSPRERVVRGPPHRALAQLGEYARRRGIARALKDEPPRRAKDRLRQPARQLWNLARVRARVQATLNHLPLIGCIAALPNVRARRRERAPPRFQSDQGDRSHIEGVRRRGADAQECRRILEQVFAGPVWYLTGQNLRGLWSPLLAIKASPRVRDRARSRAPQRVEAKQRCA